MSILRALFAALLLCLLYSCKDRAAKNDRPDESPNNNTSGNNSSDDADDKSTCGIDDGIHSATVDYYNPTTGYRATYTLDVEVDDCQVVKIDFTNGGYLDGDHIDPTDIDEDGEASVEDDKGRSFEVHIDE